MIELLVKLALAYLLGSVVGSLLLGLVRRVDVRASGSGNAGATNALRTQGRAFALAVLAIDIGKGVLAVTVLPSLPWPDGGAATGLAAAALPFVCGTGVMLGHVYPVFFGFRGGKGAATLFGVASPLVPGAVLPALAVWVGGIVLSGYVGISTILAAFTLPAYVLFTRPEGLAGPPGAFALAVFLFILYTHRSNVQRMLRGNENRFESAMLLRRLRRR
ncbi:MAG TPA: glycerol-3-phosphate 1-O-acyltransferase PlsY [Gammaproteobacteria bacterium]|nr:glycerol-3-phosphate 1-O-acyltransferase PlsY [Gammaproteobacteria bacterium]